MIDVVERSTVGGLTGRARACRMMAACAVLVGLLSSVGCASDEGSSLSFTGSGSDRTGSSAGESRGAASASRSASREWAGTVTIDGDVSEWPRATVAFADEAYLYLRFSVEGELSTLQSAEQTVTVHLDVDGDGGTGASMLDPIDAAGMGVDVEVQFSPRNSDGTFARGARAYVVDSAGTRTQIPTAALDLVFAPTYGSEWYELRLSRHVATGTDMSSLEADGAWEGIVTLSDENGVLKGWSDAFVATKPLALAEPPLADATLPAKPAGAIRVLNWNMLRNAPEKNPGGFARIISLAKPDVILAQEWVAEDPAQIEAWFHEHVESPTGSWHVLAGKAWGVAIIAPHKITPLIQDGVTFPLGTRDYRSRLVAGVVPLGVGDIVVASTHLKCCGFAGSEEDRTRIAEARAIAQTFESTVAGDPTWVRVLGGDLNLVGSRTPLDEIRKGLDIDGSDLEIAPVTVLGDRSVYTWVDWAQPFTPGRLDYVLYSGAGSEVLNAIALDTRRLSDAALASMGIEREDSGVSDHLPIVVDIRIKP